MLSEFRALGRIHGCETVRNELPTCRGVAIRRFRFTTG
jgi:hypothetical protein